MYSSAIIIVTMNCWEHLFRCLDALKGQSCRDFRIIVVNNGNASSDQEKLLDRYERLRYVKSDSNLGFAAGNNLGIALADDCEWIVLLNPDTIPARDWFKKMISAIKQYPQYKVFGSLLLQAEHPQLLDGAGDRYHISGYAWRHAMGMPAKSTLNIPWEVFSPCAAAAMYQRDVLRSVGGLDEDFFCYMEDVDLGFRLRLAGHQCLIVPDAKVLHVGSVTTGKRSPFYVYHGQRNLIWAFVKNMPGILFWLFLPLHFVLNIAGVLRYALSGRLKVVLRAKYDAIKAFPEIWQKRREVQMARRVGCIKILKVLDKSPVPGLGRIMSSLWK